MFRLASILHLFIGSTLSGVGIILALTTGMTTVTAILGFALIGFLAAFPVAYLIAKKIYEDG
ncbi:CTP synthetase [Shimia biformata]|uniref:CTP synthetase n=1 Tax=Shimia biformata TaxID=1294299 RepID=UPI00194FF586|nr:CTP synthetase [Shimia biformata]